MTMSEFEEFRWKIVEIFLAYASTRGCIGKWQRSLHRALHDDHARVVSELEAVKTVLGQATVLDCVSNPEQPLERDDLSPQPNAEREGQQFDEEEIQSLLGRELSGATTPSSRAKRESTTSATTGKSQPNVQTDEIEPSKGTDRPVGCLLL